MSDRYSAEYTIHVRQAVHDEATDSLIGLQAIDGVRSRDSLEFTGELGGGSVKLKREQLFVGNLVRFRYQEVRYKLMILQVDTEEVRVKIVEEGPGA